MQTTDYRFFQDPDRVHFLPEPELDLDQPTTEESVMDFIETVQMPFGTTVTRADETLGTSLETADKLFIQVGIQSPAVPQADKRYDGDTWVQVGVKVAKGVPLREFAHEFTTSLMMLLCHEALEMVSLGGQRLYEPHGAHNPSVLRLLIGEICAIPDYSVQA